jgi:hypothetical protein
MVYELTRTIMIEVYNLNLICAASASSDVVHVTMDFGSSSDAFTMSIPREDVDDRDSSFSG